MATRESWFDPKASQELWVVPSAVIAQFFFDTNERTVRLSDQQVMLQLIAHLRIALRRGRVEIAILGYADYRGHTDYNKTLAGDRARALATALQNALRDQPNFTTISAVSLGESIALQKTDDAHRLAFDRRVDVYSSSRIFDFVVMPPAVLPLKTPRTTYMQWIKADAQIREHHRNPSDALLDDVKGRAVDWLVGKIGEDNPFAPGRERRWLRRFGSFDPSHRVVTVKVAQVKETQIAIVATLSTITTDVEYAWGRATPVIQVDVTEIDRVAAGPIVAEPGAYLNKTKSTSSIIDRKIAEKSSFFFPDSNWAPPRVR